MMSIAIDTYESCDFEIVLETHIHGKDWSTEVPKSFSKQNMCIVNISERITKKTIRIYLKGICIYQVKLEQSIKCLIAKWVSHYHWNTDLLRREAAFLLRRLFIVIFFIEQFIWRAKKRSPL